MSPRQKEISYIISVSQGKGCYRHIKISSKALFFDLHEKILNSFEFSDDHAHAFFLDNRAWSDAASIYSDMIEDEESYTSEIKLEKAGLYVGMNFKYIFDFGDEWIFQCKVLRITDEKTKEAEIIRSVGEPLPQYEMEMYDDEDDEDDFDEDEVDDE